MSEVLLNLSAWIVRRKTGVGPYADHIIHSVEAYETEITALRARDERIKAIALARSCKPGDG